MLLFQKRVLLVQLVELNKYSIHGTNTIPDLVPDENHTASSLQHVPNHHFHQIEIEIEIESIWVGFHR